MLETNLLLVHLLGVVLFFSNAVAALFWQAVGSRSRHPAVVAHTFRTLNLGDRWLTPIAVVAITGSGIALAVAQGQPMLRTGWILWSIVAFSGSGVAFAAAALPRQRRLARWLTRCAEGGEAVDWLRYRREVRSWALWADLSLALALLALWLMVAQPDLPAY